MHNLRADLDQLLPQGRQRPCLSAQRTPSILLHVIVSQTGRWVRHAGPFRGSARSRARTVSTTRLAIQSLGVDRTPGILETGPSPRTANTPSCMVPDNFQETVPVTGQLNTLSAPPRVGYSSHNALYATYNRPQQGLATPPMGPPQARAATTRSTHKVDPSWQGCGRATGAAFQTFPGSTPGPNFVEWRHQIDSNGPERLSSADRGRILCASTKPKNQALLAARHRLWSEGGGQCRPRTEMIQASWFCLYNRKYLPPWNGPPACREAGAETSGLHLQPRMRSCDNRDFQWKERARRFHL